MLAMSKAKVDPKTFFTIERLEYIRCEYTRGVNTRVIANKLGCTRTMLQNKLRELGLSQSRRSDALKLPTFSPPAHVD